MEQFEFTPGGYENCKVKAWLHDALDGYQINYPAVIICPGGAYAGVSGREAEPVAAPFYTAGFNTFILYYSIGARAAGFEPLCQLAATIAEVRERSEDWHTIPNKIAVCGFSAGGHLAASLGVLFNEPEFLKIFGSTKHIRPDAVILGYPVITSDAYTHVESIENVSGSPKGSETYKWFGLDNHVDAQTPPMFLWHTAADSLVPVENSLKMAAALSAEKIPFELHVLPEGEHGMSVCTEEVGTPSAYNARWVEWCIVWLREQMNFSKGE